VTGAESDPAVLVVTSLEDVTADLVITALNRRGVPVVRADSADIGSADVATSLTFAARIGADGSAPEGTGQQAKQWAGSLRTGTRRLDLQAVRAVYHRRPSPWLRHFEQLPDQARAFAAAEARFGLGGLLTHLPVLHVNPPAATARAEYKPLQLQIAADLGFTVPTTLITNDPAAARRFIGEQGRVVYKTFRGVPPANGRTGAIWTQQVEAAEIDDSIAVTAHLFQAEVMDKVGDARVTVVGRGESSVFASLIQTSDRRIDWRSGDWDELACTPVDVPDSVVKGMYRYLDQLGLVFGCFDFAIGPGQVWHWIECNPNGQWGFLPDSAAIAEAFAALLQAG
jgi:ATP-grasp ribosomal peptide maturase